MSQAAAGEPAAESARLSRDLLRYLPAAAVPAVCALLGAALFTRLFSPAAYGLFSLVLSITGPLSTVLGQPTGQAASRFYSEYRARREEGLYRAAMTVLSGATAAGALGVMGLGLATAGWWRHIPGGAPLVLAAGALVLGSALTTALLPVLAASFRPAPYTLALSGAAVLSVGVSAALVLLEAPRVVYLVLGPAIAALAVLPIVVRRVHLVAPRQLWRLWHDAAVREALTRFLAYGTPLATWFVLTSLLSSGDRYVLAWLSGTRAVGVYSVNYTLSSQAVGLLNLPVVTAAWPVIARQWAGARRAAMGKSLTALSTLYLTLALGVAAAVWTASRPLATLLLGPAFRAGYAVCGPVLAGTVLWGLARIGQKSLELHERTGWMVKDAAVAAAASLLLTALLVPRWSYMGAAWATLAGYALYTALVWRDARRCIPWTLDAPALMSSLGVAAGAACAVSQWLPQPHAAVVAAAADGGATALLYGAGLVARDRMKYGSNRTWKNILQGLFLLDEL